MTDMIPNGFELLKKRLRMMRWASLILVIMMSLSFHAFALVLLWSIWDAIATFVWVVPFFVFLALIPFIFIYFYMGTMISSYRKSGKLLKIIEQGKDIDNKELLHEASDIIGLSLARFIIATIAFIFAFSIFSILILRDTLNQKELEEIYYESQIYYDSKDEVNRDLK